jgi:hypothetical protein
MAELLESKLVGSGNLPKFFEPKENILLNLDRIERVDKKQIPLKKGHDGREYRTYLNDDETEELPEGVYYGTEMTLMFAGNAEGSNDVTLHGAEADLAWNRLKILTLSWWM